MIQRVQSLYLLAAFVLCVACMSLPLGFYVTTEGVRVASLTNLWFAWRPEFVVDGMVARSMRPWALFVLLLLVSSITLVNIFLYRRRALQMRVSSFCMVVIAGWYAAYAFFAYVLGHGLEASFRPNWSAAFPLCALIFLYLAFRAIHKDEALVRSLDRLR